MQSSGIVGFVETAARHRAACYLDRAAELRRMAQEEPIGSLQTRLLGLKRNYEELAAGLGAQHRHAIRARSTQLPGRVTPQRNSI